MGKKLYTVGAGEQGQAYVNNFVQSGDQTLDLFDLVWFLQKYLVCLYCATEELTNYSPELDSS